MTNNHDPENIELRVIPIEHHGAVVGFVPASSEQVWSSMVWGEVEVAQDTTQEKGDQ